MHYSHERDNINVLIQMLEGNNKNGKELHSAYSNQKYIIKYSDVGPVHSQQHLQDSYTYPMVGHTIKNVECIPNLTYGRLTPQFKITLTVYQVFMKDKFYFSYDDSFDATDYTSMQDANEDAVNRIKHLCGF